MLAPDDRSVLLDLLRPPPEMSLDVAVATTFTLDLEAALVAPLAFAAFDSSGPGDPIATLEAVRSVAERLTVFCQAGSVSVPNAASDLFAFLEPVVHQVRRPRPGHLFHPKLWVLRYSGEEDAAFRLIVPTRNLTNDSSWDAVLRLDGIIEGGPRASNRPIADLLRWCLTHSIDKVTPDRFTAVEALIEDVRRVHWQLPAGVNDLAFHALGIGGRRSLDYSGRRHLVLSPFVSADGIDVVAPSDEVILVSRPEQMDLLPTEYVESIDCRAIASMGADNDLSVPEVDAEPRQESLGELHAKIVVTERARRAHLFVGSANATGAAFSGNVEIVVELVGGPKALGIDATLADLGSVLEPVTIDGGAEPSERDELQRTLDDILRDAAMNRVRLLVRTSGDDGLYSVAASSEQPLVPSGISVRGTLELLSRPGHAAPVEAGERLDASFDGVALANITPFIVLRIELESASETVSGGVVVRGELVDAPPERFDALIARQVDSPSKFLRFLFLLLSLAGGVVPPWLQPRTDGEPNRAEVDRRILDAGVFEAVVRALVTHPAALDDLARLVERLRATSEGRATLPDGFDELWVAVLRARNRVGSTR